MIIEAVSAVLLEAVVEVILILRCAYHHASQSSHINSASRSIRALHRQQTRSWYIARSSDCSTHHDERQPGRKFTWSDGFPHVHRDEISKDDHRIHVRPSLDIQRTISDRIYFLHSISSVVFEGVLFGLTIHKFLEAQKEGWGYISLLNVLIRDSIWAFALLFSKFKRVRRHGAPLIEFCSCQHREHLVVHNSSRVISCLRISVSLT